MIRIRNAIIMIMKADIPAAVMKADAAVIAEAAIEHNGLDPWPLP